jgi:hypothetical protein
LETKVKVLIVGIVLLLAGFIAFLFLVPLNSALVSFGAYAIVVGFLVTLIGFVEVAADKESLRATKRKIILLALIVIAIGLTVPYSVWAIITPIYTPNWAFSVTTDKSSYELGEPIQIRVTLENLGFIDHSFTSSVSNPIVVVIYRQNIHQVWYSSFNNGTPEFTIPPHQSLGRNFTWNQTNIRFPEKEIEPGAYIIYAFIPQLGRFMTMMGSELIWGITSFVAKTNINITSTLR